MSARTLERIKLGLSPDTGEAFIYRHGSNPGIALEARSAMRELITSFIGHMMFNLPEGQTGSARNINIGRNWYRVMAIMIEDPTVKEPEVSTETTGNAEVPQDQQLPKAD